MDYWPHFLWFNIIQRSLLGIPSRLGSIFFFVVGALYSIHFHQEGPKWVEHVELSRTPRREMNPLARNMKGPAKYRSIAVIFIPVGFSSKPQTLYFLYIVDGLFSYQIEQAWNWRTIQSFVVEMTLFNILCLYRTFQDATINLPRDWTIATKESWGKRPHYWPLGWSLANTINIETVDWRETSNHQIYWTIAAFCI